MPAAPIIWLFLRHMPRPSRRHNSRRRADRRPKSIRSEMENSRVRVKLLSDRMRWITAILRSVRRPIRGRSSRMGGIMRVGPRMVAVKIRMDRVKSWGGANPTNKPRQRKNKLKTRRGQKPSSIEKMIRDSQMGNRSGEARPTEGKVKLKLSRSKIKIL